MAASTTVRVTPQTRERLARLSESRGVSTPDLIEQLAARAEEDALLDAMNEDFGALRRNWAASADYRAELEQWDATLLDGLDR